MGGAVSAGQNNDELVDNLVDADYIKTAAIERVFRAVDRGHYFTPECKESAYNDLAWKCGNLHISAPCIYSEVMENLKLAPGMSFLNLGSGTGYLSTMAGLILGSNGVNHGVELHEDVINYANERLEEFYLVSPAIDEYEFCPPRFINGNCLFLGSEVRQYDRVYCGAACPENHENYMKNLIKVGGILVMPINDQLLQIYRTSDTYWETKSVLPVSFATLVSENILQNGEPLKTPETNPLSLQDICRYTVRSILRRIINIENPELKKRPPRVPRKRVKKRTLRRLVIPIFGNPSDSEENETEPMEADNTRRDLGRGGFFMDVQNVRTCRTVIELSHIFQDAERNGTNRSKSVAESGSRSAEEHEMKDTDDDSDSSLDKARTQSDGDVNMSDDDFSSELDEVDKRELKKESNGPAKGKSSVEEKPLQQNCVEQQEESTCSSQQKSKAKDTKREKFDSGIVEDIDNGKSAITDSDEFDNEDSNDNENKKDDIEDEDAGDNEDEDDEDDDRDRDEDNNDEMEVERIRSKPKVRRRSIIKLVEPDTDSDSDSDTDNDNDNDTFEIAFNCESGKGATESKKDRNKNLQADATPCQANPNTYSTYMKEKINKLPLPITLKCFLNLNRDL